MEGKNRRTKYFLQLSEEAVTGSKLSLPHLSFFTSPHMGYESD